MNLLRILRHGPLLFWVSSVLVLFATLGLAWSNGTETASAEYTSDQAWLDVETWRSSLVQLPLVASGGEVSGFGKALYETATDNAQEARSAGADDYAAAWDAAARAAEQLAKAEDGGQGEIQAAIRALGISGDRLAALASGSGWIESDLPKELQLLDPQLDSQETPSTVEERLHQ